MIHHTLCQKFELVLVGEVVRSGSLVKRLFPKKQLQAALIPGGSSETILRTLRTKPLALLGSSFFHSKYFGDILKQVDFALECQISFGHEYRQCEKAIGQYLKAGHLLQVWFDKPEELEQIEVLFKKYREQVSPVFILSKTSNPLALLGKIENSSIYFLSPPKQHKQDSFFSPKELFLWSEKLRQKTMPQVIYFGSLFEERTSFEKKFYQQLDTKSLGELLGQREIGQLELMKIHCNRFFSLLVSLPRRVTSTIKWSCYSFGLRCWGALKAIAVISYWRLRIINNRIKIHALKFKWTLYSLALKILGEVKALSVKIYWQGRKLSSQAKILAIQLYWAIYPLVKTFLGKMWAFMVKIYWQAHRLSVNLKLLSLRLKWLGYTALQNSIGILHALVVKFYWQAHRLATKLKLLSLRWKWLGYTALQNSIGALRALIVKFYWQAHRLATKLKLLSLRWKWLGYTALQNSIGASRALWIRGYWKSHTILQRLRWKTYQLRRQGIGEILRLWGESHGFRIRLLMTARLLSIHTYYALKKILWPLRKFYWFAIYQWNSRILPWLDRRRNA